MDNNNRCIELLEESLAQREEIKQLGDRVRMAENAIHKARRCWKATGYFCECHDEYGERLPHLCDFCEMEAALRSDDTRTT